MRVTSGKVVSGHIITEGEPLPEGSVVTVFAREADEGFELDATAEGELLLSIAEADRGETHIGGRGVSQLPRDPIMSIDDVISSDREVQGGAVVFAGTRVPLKNLIDYLEGGDSIEAFLEHFPSVTREQAVAALKLAQQALVTLAGTH